MPRKPKQEKAKGVFEKPKGSGIWWIRYTDSDGKRRSESVGRFGDAKERYNARKLEIKTGTAIIPDRRRRSEAEEESGTRLTALIDHAVTFSKNNHTDSRNFIIRAEAWRTAFGSRLADSLKPAELSEWLERQMQQCGWSAATFNRHKAALSTIYRLAIQNSHVQSNPARLISQKRESRGRIRFLTEEEEARLREKIMEHRPHCAEQLDIALNTGMRKGEQFSIEWTEVDLRQEYIHLDKTKNGSDRYVYLNKTCMAALERLLEVRRKRGFEFPTLFYDHRGMPIKDPSEWFEKTCKEAKVFGVTWHVLRHTFASRLVMRGINLKTLQELMGHKTIAMTARYAHLAPGFLKDAVNKLDEKDEAA